MEHPKESICYSFAVDSTSPSHLKKCDRIFNISLSDDIGYGSNSYMDMSTEYSDAEQTASQNVATSMSVKGNYGAFSGSASMQVNRSCDSSIKTVRLDAKCAAGIASVTPKGNFKSFPEEFLTPSFKRAVAEHDFEEFAENIGVFYATHMKLGGLVNKSYTMLASRKDTESSVKSELEASYGKGCFGVTGQASAEVTNRSSSSSSKMKTEWRAQGGDTTIWLGYNFGPGDNAQEIASAWAASVNESNAFPIGLTLKPIWHLVKKVDERKGAGLEEYLKAKWAKSASEFNPSKFLDIAPLICEHPRWRDMVKRAQSHHDWCRDQKESAQSWVDTWYAGADITRNRNWRDAAEEGKNVMNRIVEQIKGKKTVDEFKEWLHGQWKDRDCASKKHWGMGGRDSGESNRVQGAHRDCIKDIQKMI